MPFTTNLNEVILSGAKIIKRFSPKVLFLAILSLQTAEKNHLFEICVENCETARRARKGGVAGRVFRTMLQRDQDNMLENGEVVSFGPTCAASSFFGGKGAKALSTSRKIYEFSGSKLAAAQLLGALFCTNAFRNLILGLICLFDAVFDQHKFFNSKIFRKRVSVTSCHRSL